MFGSAAAITPLNWDLGEVIAAVAVVLLAYAAYRYAIVWQRWRLSGVALLAEQRRRESTLSILFNPYVLTEPVRDAGGHVVDFIYVDANPPACDWIGVDREHLLGHRLLEMFPTVESTGLLRIFTDTAETGRPVVIEAFPFSSTTHGMRWLDIRAARVEDQVGFTWRDVTARHEAEENMKASEEHFRLLAENSSDVVAHIRSDGTILWVSPSVTPVLGWLPEDCIGRKSDDFFALSEGREQFRRDLQLALAGRSIVLRAQVVAKEGDARWVEIHAGPYRTETRHVESIVASFRRIDTEIEAEHILERRASTDELTSLLNRKKAFEQVDTLAKDRRRTLAALWCDIDRFKVVNDTYGHAAGDAVLKAVADRIRGCLRSTDDTGARIGGDELLVLLHDVHGLQDAAEVAEKLRKSAAEPIPTAAGPVSITLSIGVTLAHPDESTDALIARADDAMYLAKQRGRNQVVAIADDEAGGTAAGEAPAAGRLVNDPIATAHRS
jgi:diguanylate cyclase (GGDEF)-like protein/PAS domain S-box-containing protein